MKPFMTAQYDQRSGSNFNFNAKLPEEIHTIERYHNVRAENGARVIDCFVHYTLAMHFSNVQSVTLHSEHCNEEKRNS